MGICVITGASSGIGRAFFRQLAAGGERFDAFWVIARHAAALETLQSMTDTPVRVLALDLSDPTDCASYGAALERERPDIRLLVHCAGFGKFDATTAVGVQTNCNMVDLNVRGTVSMNLQSLNYMTAGARIINIASVAALQPVPWINTYAATKAFVLSFSRSLNRELKNRGIHVLAVCPFWTKTAFFDRAADAHTPPVVKHYAAMYDPEDVARRALRDSAGRRKDVSIYGFVARGQALLVRLLPVRLVMTVWQKQQKLK